MSRIPRIFGAFTFLVLFTGSSFVAALPQGRPPLPPGVKGKDLEKLRRQANNNNDKRRQEYERKKKEENDRYHVAQIGFKFEVVQKKKLGSVRKSAPKKYKAQLAQYEKARKAAEKKGRSFKGLKPPETVFKLLSGNGYKTQKEAQNNARRLQRQVDSRRKK